MSAEDLLLQEVDLTEFGLSTEGGQATLHLLEKTANGTCRIEVIHFGETGRRTYRFLFDDELRYAARRDFRYPLPISMMTGNDFKMTLEEEVVLSGEKGAHELPEEFREYREYFEPANLSRCGKTPNG